MGRAIRLPLLTLFASLLLGTASATTYYIAANGSDSNNGTSKTAPWLHAPGMQGCSSACASASPQAGDRFILRGGDTWHYSAGSPVGLPWTWTRSGTSGSPIYIGVDSSWSASASWVRPALTMDNPLTTSSPSSCNYDDTSNTSVTISGNYVTFDNFEFTGKCWGGSNPSGAYIMSSGNHIKVSNSYVHGWSVATTAGDDNHYMFGGTGSGNTGNEWDHNVVDGADSTFGAACTNSNCVANISSRGATGWAFGQECYNVHHNVIRHVSNGIECGSPTWVHDNLLEYLFEPSFGGRHGNNVEALGGTSGLTAYIYNNVTRNTNEGVDWWLQFSTGYIFNNVFENSGAVYGNPPSDPNCLMPSPVGWANSAVVVTTSIFNNTFDGTCVAQAYAGNGTTPHWASGSSVTWGNNHILVHTSLSDFFSCNSPSQCSQADRGGELFQSNATASAQGYTLANDYAPTSSSGATIGAGVNLTSLCSAMDSPTGTAACKNGLGGVSYDAVNHVAVDNSLTSRPSSGAWDAGAYEFNSGVANSPTPPSGLVAIVQ